jgi:hypothetical protein
MKWRSISCYAACPRRRGAGLRSVSMQHGRGASGSGRTDRSGWSRIAQATHVVLDDMSDATRWEAAPASGVHLRLGNDAGADGGMALRIDFDFRGGGGWAALRRQLPVRLPENYGAGSHSPGTGAWSRSVGATSSSRGGLSAAARSACGTGWRIVAPRTSRRRSTWACGRSRSIRRGSSSTTPAVPRPCGTLCTTEATSTSTIVSSFRSPVRRRSVLRCLTAAASCAGVLLDEWPSTLVLRY